MEEAVRSDASEGKGVVGQHDDPFDGQHISTEHEQSLEEEVVRPRARLDVGRIEPAALGSGPLWHEEALLLEDRIREVGLRVMEQKVLAWAVPAGAA